MGGTYIQTWDYLIPASYLTREEEQRVVGVGPKEHFAVFEGIPHEFI